MRIRFQADADLNQAILQGTIRREPTIDFQTANEAGLSGLNDPEVLAIASNDGRTLVTHDHRTMPNTLWRISYYSYIARGSDYPTICSYIICGRRANSHLVCN